MKYVVKVMTGDADGAGTDSAVAIIFNGSRGSSKLYLLDAGGNDFERASFCPFDINVEENIGRLESITIKTDDAGWLLDSIIVCRGDDHWLFVWGDWYRGNSDDGLKLVPKNSPPRNIEDTK